MFLRNENRNEGTFAKTTLLETALLSPSDPFWWFPKGWFWRMFPRNENRNEGTFTKTTLLRNRPFISQWFFTELILEKAGPVILRPFTGIIAFRVIPVICPARRAKSENYWKRSLIPDRAYRAIKSVIVQKLSPGTIFRIRYNFGPDSTYFCAQRFVWSCS